MTAIAPIEARQINNNLYVGYSDLTTIQKAVNAAKTTGEVYEVIIPLNYMGSDTVAGVTGGTTSVYITDQRTAQPQWYAWNGTNYVPIDITFYSNVICEETLTATHLSGGDISVTTNYSGVGTTAPPWGGKITWNISGGAGEVDFINGHLAWDGGFYWYNRPADSVMDSTTPPLMMLQGSNGDLDVTGNVISKGSILAPYPPAGVPVSTGSAWAASMNPANFALLTGANFLGPISAPTIGANDAHFGTCEVDGSPVLTEANSGGLFVQPPPGVVISTGTGWDTPIDPADLPRLSTQNTFALTQVSQKQFRAYGFAPLDITQPHITIGTSNTGVNPLITLVNASAPTGQKVWTIGAGTNEIHFAAESDTGADYYWMQAFRTGTNVTGVTITPPLTVVGNIGTNADLYVAGQSHLTNGHLVIWDRGGATYDRSQPNINTAAPDLFINPGPNGKTYLNLDNGNGLFIGGTGGVVVSIDTGGNTIFKGNVIGNSFYCGPVNADGTYQAQFASSGGTTAAVVSRNTTTTAKLGILQLTGYSSDYSHASTYLNCYQDPTSGVTANFQDCQNVIINGYFDVEGNVAFGHKKLLLGERAAMLASNPTVPNINSDGNSLIINGTTSGYVYFNWDPGSASQVTFGDGAGHAVAWVDKTGTFAAAHYTSGTMDLSSDGSSTYFKTGSNLLITGSGNAVFENVGIFLQNAGGANVTQIAPNGNATFGGGVTIGGGLTYICATNNLTIQADGATSFIDGGCGYRLYLNYFSGGSGVVHVAGTFEVAGSKTFTVAHPLDDSKDLIHACLEGPENGVFYRGEVTTKMGQAMVELPDYFEALTFPEDRSVLLTQIDDGEELAALAASPVVKGKFRIRSNVRTVRVAWEVKAVRKVGVERLKVTADKFKHPKETVDEQRKRATERTGKTQDGELRAEASGAQSAATSKSRAAHRVH